MMQHGIGQWLVICETVAKPVARGIASSFFNICWKKVLKIFSKISGRSNVFIISKRQSSLSNKFYDRNQTLQAEAISDIVRIDWPEWLVLYQFIHLRLNGMVASICSIESWWLLRRSRACFQSKISFLIMKCAHLVVSAHNSLQVKHLTQVCEGEKQSQLLSTTSPLWFWRRIRLGVHFRDKFLCFLCCGTSCLKNDFSSQCQKEPVSYFNQYSSISSAMLAGQRAQRPISLPPVIASAISSIVFFDNTFWRSSATALLVKLGLFSSLRRSKSVTTCSSIFCPQQMVLEFSIFWTCSIKATRNDCKCLQQSSLREFPNKRFTTTVGLWL